MEFIRVRFDLNDVRDVIANGNVIGQTEAELIVETDYYVISLSGSGYTPSHRYVLVTGTVPGNPLIVQFTKV
jgi:hypothetical protein